MQVVHFVRHRHRRIPTVVRDESQPGGEQLVILRGIAARGLKLLGMSYRQWCSIRFSLLSLFATGILVHVMLYW